MPKPFILGVAKNIITGTIIDLGVTFPGSANSSTSDQHLYESIKLIDIQIRFELH